jgi:hypothetical protein
MSEDWQNRRRAVYTGLHPYLSEEMLIRALEHWEQHYAEAPRFALQRFVHEICQLADLRERRSDIHLNLVQAMNMPADALLDDSPVRGQVHDPDAATADQYRAFEQLLNCFLDQLDESTDQQLRLDLLASLRRQHYSDPLLHQLQRWLLDGEALASGNASIATLRAIVNQAYVLLAQYRGPGTADQTLHQATERVRSAQPALTDALAGLL